MMALSKDGMSTIHGVDAHKSNPVGLTPLSLMMERVPISLTTYLILMLKVVKFGKFTLMTSYLNQRMKMREMKLLSYTVLSLMKVSSISQILMLFLRLIQSRIDGSTSMTLRATSVIYNLNLMKTDK